MAKFQASGGRATVTQDASGEIEVLETVRIIGQKAFFRKNNQWHDSTVTPEQAAAIVAAAKYPPHGTRGVGLSRAQGYAEEFDVHYRWLNEESIVFVQIEHIDAVGQLEAILRTPGVDGFFIGPYDLSASLGIPGDFQHPKMQEAMSEVKRVQTLVPTVPGIHVVQPVPSDAQARLAEGFRFIAFGIDYLFLLNHAKETLGAVTRNL